MKSINTRAAHAEPRSARRRALKKEKQNLFSRRKPFNFENPNYLTKEVRL